MFSRKNFYSGDPRWIKAKFDGICNKCKAIIPKGAEAYYYPNGKYIYCEKCGTDCEADFQNCVEVEQFYSSSY
jgi:hypothetical protein